MTTPRVIDARHPIYFSSVGDWEKWRLTFAGGSEFKSRYLKEFSAREDHTEFGVRREITPVPAFAKSALLEIRNSIFQRMRDIVRKGGSKAYQQAISGKNAGVDNRGHGMNAFLGEKVLGELLVMGKCGIFVDAPVLSGETIADTRNSHPYLYHYACEDILNFSMTMLEEESTFDSLLLRDTVLKTDASNYLPVSELRRYRHFWIDKADGRVMVQFYDQNGAPVDREGEPGGPRKLDLTRIPFVLVDIGHSLLKDVCDHQIALLNLGSSDISYAIKSNFPFYVEQRDMRKVGSHLKVVANEDGTATAGGQGATDTDIRVGSTNGRAYDLGMNAPGFIAPPSDPLMASLKLQDKLEADIRKLVNLAVQTLATRASAESKNLDNQGLESGLSFIGLTLETAERQIADYWARYESRDPSSREIATVKYPERYSLKSDKERLDEADKLTELGKKVPGRTFKREIAKTIVECLLGGKITVEQIDKIHSEIDSSEYTISDPEILVALKEAGLVGEKTASVAAGFSENEHLAARKDHVDRVKRIAEAQGEADMAAAARGVPDMDGDPANSGGREKELSRQTDQSETTKKPVRGDGK
jgi:hypothetical protein